MTQLELDLEESKSYEESSYYGCLHNFCDYVQQLGIDKVLIDLDTVRRSLGMPE